MPQGASEQLIPFGVRLHELLQRAGPHATQAWLATRSGLDRSLVSRVMRGQRPPTGEALACLAPALGVEVIDLVRGTTAEERFREGVDHVRRADFEEAVARMVEFEGKNRDLEARVRSLTETLSRERASRTTAEEKAHDSMLELERASAGLRDLEERHATQAAELTRYQHALVRAVSDFSALKKQVCDLQAELGDAKQSSKTASILAGVAAVASVATIAHFLGDDEHEQPSARKWRGRRTGT